MADVSVVVPTVGRPSLTALLDALERCSGPRPREIVLVDDRPDASTPLLAARPDGWVTALVSVRRSGGRGPAAARNAGWRTTHGEWVAFLDDDVLVPPTWLDDLDRDLAVLPPDVAGSQGRITVPLPADRRPTDWERGTAGLAPAKWITADIAYRREVLEQVGGFDERFPRAFREDADLALRVLGRGHRLVVGERLTTHPVRPAPWNASLSQQRGNADDVLMTRLHGRDWYQRAEAAKGRRARHLAIVGSGLLAVGATALRQRRLAAVGALGWLAGTVEFACARIAPGPRTPREVAAMTATSIAIPPAAAAHRLRGLWQHRHAAAWQATPSTGVKAVLFDRDGTLVHDVPYNGDPALVLPMPGAAEVLARVRASGLRTGVVSNQSGIARGRLTTDQVDAVNTRVDELLGPFDTWQYCPHGEWDGCDCRKPQPGLIKAAAAALGVDPSECVLIGDIGSDIAAGEAAGVAAAVLVPTPATRPEEIAAARHVAPDLAAAVAAVLGGDAR
ncbi:MAG: HAD-IIIA family hydrolase [Jatrophihabitans sp.]|uniref:HAD-IIIA family hydrolase n=1 Tax=Jatrophihabitans sp. TaxID=1932789 RepID=UPI003F806D26